MLIVETSANELFAVREAKDPALAHVWHGFPAKRIEGGFGIKANARLMLVRKAGSRVIAKVS